MVALSCAAAEKIAPGSRVFIAKADYILTGGSIPGDDKWYHTIFGGKDKNEGNVHLIDVQHRQLVWAGEAGDRSLWPWGVFLRGGQRKVADRIVKRLKADLFEP